MVGAFAHLTQCVTVGAAASTLLALILHVPIVDPSSTRVQLMHKFVIALRNTALSSAMLHFAMRRRWIKWRQRASGWAVHILLPFMGHWTFVEAAYTALHTAQHAFPVLYHITGHEYHHSIRQPYPIDAFQVTLSHGNPGLGIRIPNFFTPRTCT